MTDAADTTASPLPANARIDTITFDPGAKALDISLRSETQPRRVSADTVKALFGARIRHQSVTFQSGGKSINAGKLAVTVATGIPVGLTSGSKAASVVGEELHHALALRVDGVAEVWYLLAQSFNFRKALGPDALYSTELNLRAFIKRLAEFVPNAARDAYFIAAVDRKDLPLPVESLFEFLRTASA